MKTLKEKEHTKNNDWGTPTQMYYKQDVKEAVLEFEEYLEDYGELRLLNKFKAIFGDFEK
jgi:hypothetical protein